MGQPAVVMNDRIIGNCVHHQIPAAAGAPAPAGPLPFSAPLTQGLTTKVMVMGKPAAVLSSSGYNTPPHVGLHGSDPQMSPTMQVGRIMAGSAKVMFEGKPAAHTGCQNMMCLAPGSVVGSATKVMIG
jgi:uncharacterized Zn-binding protein involved in type VI secretion